jgi:hypothetical protein
VAAAPTAWPAGSRVHPTAATPTRDQRPGPPFPGGVMLAVCGVTPRAGASTLSHLIALAGACRGDGRVLLCHTRTPAAPPAPTRAKSALQSLAALFVRPAPDGAATLRVVVAPDGAEPTAAAAAHFGRKLVRARHAYRFTVVDCGELRRPLERIALAHATHLVWVLPATADGLAQARCAVRAARGPAGGRQLVIAWREPSGHPATLPTLRRLADQCDAPLILAPYLPPRVLTRPASALDRAQLALQAVLGVLER